MKQIPIISLCGFLGSGKTTLLRRWLREEAAQDAAVIVHDLSDFGLDAELLVGEEKKVEAGSLTGRVAALHGSHAREDLHPSVGTALEQMADLDPAPPFILCESTGAARPWPLIRSLTQDERFFLRHFIVTVDALNLHRDFADAEVLTGDVQPPQDEALLLAASVLAEQIAFASIVILTKIDTIPETVIQKQIQTLQKLQPHAAIGLSAQAGLLLSQLDGTPAPNLSNLQELAERFHLPADASTAERVEPLVLRDPRPFHPQRLYEACQNHLGTGLYRTKGYLWLATRASDVLLWQQSGSQISLEHAGFWRVELALNKDGKLLEEEVAQMTAQLEKQHPLFGDRHNELTLIGLERDRKAFLAAVSGALCTDAEIEAWQGGETFPDPWPKSVRKVD